MDNPYLIAVLGLIVLEYVLNVVVNVANIRHVRTTIPEEFKGWYDEEKYARSQQYLKETTRFDLIHSTITTPIVIAFIVLGGFRWINDVAVGVGGGVVITGLVFAALLALLYQALGLPFQIYDTFVIEQKYGFNKTTVATYIADLVKSALLMAVIGGGVFAALVWFFANVGPYAWLYSWIALTALQFVILYLAPVFILPIFNTFLPLDDGELKDSISQYAEKEGFQLKGIFTVDGSRRSTKSNAYFTGFGRWRRIVLYDTLVENHAVSELVSVLAHEVGHYKLRHIQKMLVISILSSGLMFYILSLFITRPGLYGAFGLDMAPIDGAAPVYAGLVFFGFLYTPISLLLGLLQNRLSRKHEYEADAFAVDTYGDPNAMVNALKKLSVDNLSNLLPHPLKVVLEYSHPPVLKRIEAIREVSTA